MNQTIIQAIQNKQVLEIRYHGFSRVVEAHAYGTNKENRPMLRCFQTSGGSVSGERVGWKLLLLDEAASIATTGLGFAFARPGYKRGDSAMQYIYAQI